MLEEANQIFSLGEDKLKRLMKKYPECKALYQNAERFGFYLYCRHKKKQTHKMAEMLAYQRAPRCMTDRELFEGMGTLADQFPGEDRYVEMIVAGARANGYEPGLHDVYMPNLARFTGDPEAFVPPTGGRGHIKKICEKRGIPCEGAVNVSAPPVDKEPAKVRLGEDLVEESINEMVRQDPDIARKATRRDLRDEVISKHGSQ